MIFDDIRLWLQSNDITNAVVGYSGGIDSTVTALALSASGAKVHLVIAEAPNQRYSSSYGGIGGALRLVNDFSLEGVFLEKFSYPFTDNDVANEAALPILRNAVFYGCAASLRAQGHNAIVAGTANFSEAAFLGFWGKASDAAQDVYPISHLSKRQVYQLGKSFNVPEEIMKAVPSGDLLFEKTNDLRLIGATYDEIEKVIDATEGEDLNILEQIMSEVTDVKRFADNIVRNAFKYRLPFPGFHINPRLENFRTLHYADILKIAEKLNV